MWKILVGFIIFAAIALTVVFKMGDNASMQGEAGGHETSEVEKKADAPAAAEAPAAPAAPAAGEGEKK